MITCRGVPVKKDSFALRDPLFTIDEVSTTKQQMSQETFEGLSEIVDSGDDYLFNRWTSLELENDN